MLTTLATHTHNTYHGQFSFSLYVVMLDFMACVTLNNYHHSDPKKIQPAINKKPTIHEAVSRIRICHVGETSSVFRANWLTLAEDGGVIQRLLDVTQESALPSSEQSHASDRVRFVVCVKCVNKEAEKRL